MTKQTPEQIRDILAEVRFPGLDQDIVTLGYVEGIEPDGDRWRIALNITTDNQQAATAIAQDVRGRLEAAGITYELVRPTREAKAPEIVDLLPHVAVKVAVASGKGGVGKSTIAVNLALALAETGARVGLLDADIYGPSLPTLLGWKGERPDYQGEKIAPISAHGLATMSLGYLASAGTPVIWRGPMASRALEQLMSDVDWSGIDALVLDLPPGTGDIQISLAQKGGLSGAVIVTTPQDVALVDAIKGVRMFQKVDVPVLGIVENMSFFECPECHARAEIFPPGALRQEMEELGVPLVGRIPIDPAIASGGDAGTPIFLAAPESAAAEAFRSLAQTVRGSRG